MFWALTPREYGELRMVWEQAQERTAYMHASIQATLYNAHFDVQGVPFVPDDLMGRGDRKKRKAKALADKLEGIRMQREVMMQAPGDTNGVPEWALQASKRVN